MVISLHLLKKHHVYKWVKVVPKNIKNNNNSNNTFIKILNTNLHQKKC